MSDLSAIQQEFDADVASLLFSATEEEQALILSEAPWDVVDQYDHARLDEARARFTAGLAELQEGEDPTALVEEFIPAILPALRLGISIVGRSRVVKFLAGFVGLLIRPYVGKQVAPALSNAIVDAGLRLMTLEASPQDEQVAGAEAMAAVVEDTLAKLSEQDEEVLTDDRLLEAATIEAFREAAAANVPPELIIPELRETKPQKSGTWVSMPVGQAKKRYRKYTRAFDVTLTPAAARTLTTFGGRPLSTVLPPSLRGRTVRARLRLYQAVPGTTLGRIARREAPRVEGSPSAKMTRKQLHPLTPEAAATLLEEPGLGRAVSERFLSDPDVIAVGQRFYLLEIPNEEMRAAGIPSGLAATGPERPSSAEVVLHLAAGEIRVQIYLNEADAQEIATGLRQKRSTGAILARARRVYEPVVRRSLSGHQRAGIQVIHEGVSPDEFLGPALRRLHGNVRARFGQKVLVWLNKAVADVFEKRATEFITASEDPAHGVTLVVSFTNPPGLATIRRMLTRETRSPLAEEEFTGPIGAVRVEVVAGHRA
jgi:hypothetical protein